MRGRAIQEVLLVVAFSFSQLSVLSAQPIPAFVAVERIGTGTGSLTSAATAVFLDRYDPLTTNQVAPLGTTAFPTTLSGSHRRLTDSGTGTTSGSFTRFVNGQGYAVPGYDAPLATASVTTTNPALVNRIVGTVSPSFVVDTQTGYNTGVSNNFRTVATVDGSSFWGGTSNNVIYMPTVGTVGSATLIANQSIRQVRIFNSSLFFSSQTTVQLVGTAGILPTTSSTSTELPGINTNGNYTGFYFFDNPLNANDWNGTGLDTLYLSNENALPSGAGIQRYVFNGTLWNLNAVMTSSGGIRGLTATIDTSGASPIVHLWGTTTQTSANSLIYVQDVLSAGSGSFDTPIVLATAGTNTVFRGVEIALVSIPEPSTIVLVVGTLAVGIQVYLRKRPRKDAPAH